MNAQYGRDFYDHISPLSEASAAVLVPMIIAALEPSSIVDVGCGLGVWLEGFMRNGVRKVTGVDGAHVDRRALRIPDASFVAHDLAQPLPSLPRSDVAMSLEVAEHLPGTRADGFVRDLCALADVIVFSAAVPGQGGEHHVNEQWPSYWIRRFRSHGFRAVDLLRPRVMHDERVAWWYRQNVFVCANDAGFAAHPALRDAPPLDEQSLVLLHPSIAETPHVGVRGAARDLGRSVLAAARSRLRR